VALEGNLAGTGDEDNGFSHDSATAARKPGGDDSDDEDEEAQQPLSGLVWGQGPTEIMLCLLCLQVCQLQYALTGNLNDVRMPILELLQNLTVACQSLFIPSTSSTSNGSIASCSSTSSNTPHS
jgi:hypothetical protein